MFVNKDRLRILIPRVFVVRLVQRVQEVRQDRRVPKEIQVHAVRQDRRVPKEIQVHAVQQEQPDRKALKGILVYSVEGMLQAQL